ncbi:MAG TPA: MFS transporter [Dongiaceae bacterium]|nr:MFS transporter [Dongiaceae bacterium]
MSAPAASRNPASGAATPPAGAAPPPAGTPPKKPGALRTIAEAMKSPRTAAVSLLAFSSGMPLGLVWIAIPDWLRNGGVDLKIVGLVTLTQAPWTFKVLWAPLMDRWALPWLGRRRGWAALMQVALFALTLCLAGVGHVPEAPWVVLALSLAIACASATQDIAIDAYSVDILRPEEQGVAVGASRSIYRVAMHMAGALAITVAGMTSWPAVCVGLATLYLPMLWITIKAPEPEDAPRPPKTLREALWLPFLGFLGRHRALEILAFVILYKISDNLAVALLRPFLIDKGYNDVERGVVLGTVSIVATVIGTLAGGFLTTAMGLGHALWVFGFLQIFSNIGYILVDRAPHDVWLMSAAAIFDQGTSGMGTGAFSVLLLRMTQKRFSATQYALFSSLFGIPRIISGPIAGVTVNAIGWEAFFWLTLFAGIPGMLMLQRFSPVGVRDPVFTVDAPKHARPLTKGALVARGVVGGIAGLAFAVLSSAAIGGLKAMKADPTAGFSMAGPLAALLRPEGAGGWLELLGLLVFAMFVGLATAAVGAARNVATGADSVG